MLRPLMFYLESVIHVEIQSSNFNRQMRNFNVNSCSRNVNLEMKSNSMNHKLNKLG